MRTTLAFTQNVGALAAVNHEALDVLAQPAAAGLLEGHALALGVGVALLEALALGAGRHILQEASVELHVVMELAALGFCKQIIILAVFSTLRIHHRVLL